MEIKPDSGEPISELAVIYADKGDMDSLNELFSNERARESTKRIREPRRRHFWLRQQSL